MRRIGSTSLQVFPICLGGNVFGWTADARDSFKVLDAYTGSGGNFIDTSDSYMQAAEGNSGGESETIIGNWLSSRGKRDEIVLATKVGKLSGREGLSAPNIKAAAEGSLRRLKTDYIDLYYAHADDESTPLEETLAAFDELVREGKVREIAASNYSARRLSEALEVSDREGFARYVALQPHYNLVERGEYEGELSELVAREGLSSMPYYALASGFLTGKYRPGHEQAQSARSGRVQKYLNSHGTSVLEALEEVATDHDTTVASVALAWLASQPTVAAPIASARTVGQLEGILRAAELKLSESELTLLDEASV